MKKKLRRITCGFTVCLSLAVSLAGCGERGDKSAHSVPSKGIGGEPVLLVNTNSGYIGNAQAMERFLRCWDREIAGPAKAAPLVTNAQAPNLNFDSRMPKSARDFFMARANLGFMTLYERVDGDKSRFLEPASLTSFREHSPSDFDIWKTATRDINPPDAEYYRYDRRQSLFRARDLDSMLVIGRERGGAFYLLIPGEKTADGETEAMLLHHGGLIVRFKSFAHLLVNLYLEERERIAGRDPSLGHLYFFEQPLSTTCAGEIISI